MKTLDYYWYDKNTVSILLWPISQLFKVLVYIRRFFYSASIFKSVRVAKPVIIIGNITVGGTGKTPLIIALCELLSTYGLKVGVISRGYGGVGPWPHQLSVESDAATSGDEPVQLYQRTNLPIVVGPDRVKDIELLCQQNEIDIILADDGLQHYKLQRDLELIVVDEQRQFGNGFCLPAGPLREPVSRLKNNSWCVYNGGQQKYSFSILPSKVCRLNSKHEQSLKDFAGTTVHAVAGIGNPSRFFHMLRDNDINVIEHSFPDHHQFISSDIEFNDELMVLMTEKDSVKCKTFAHDNSYYVSIDIRLTEQFINDFKVKVGQLTHG